MATVTKENIGTLHDKLLVKVTKEDYLPAFEKAVKKYSKNANIPGFRKGMVPQGMVKKMYGNAIFNEEVIQMVEKELREYLKNETISYLAQPLPLENDIKLDMNKPEDYEFAFEMGRQPEISLDFIPEISVTLNKVAVTPEMVDEEVKNLLERNIDYKQIDEVTEETAFIQGKVSEEGENAEEGTVESSLQFAELNVDFKKQLLGKKAGDTFTVNVNEAFTGETARKEFLSKLNLAKDEEARPEVYNFTITTINEAEKPALNEEFFALVFPGQEIKTEEEFKGKLKEEIQKQWDQASKNQMHDQIYHKLQDQEIELPEAFLKRALEIGGDKVKPKEEVEEDYPKYAKQLKWSLISDKIIQDYNLEVSRDELRAFVKEDVKRYFGNQDLGTDTEWLEGFVDKLMEDRKRTEQTYSQLMTEKMFKALEEKVKVEEKEISESEFRELQHDHEH